MNLLVKTTLLTVGFFLLASQPAYSAIQIATLTRVEGTVRIFSNPAKKMKGPPPHALYEDHFYTVKDAEIGERCKIQSHAFICELVTIGNDCFFLFIISIISLTSFKSE